MDFTLWCKSLGDWTMKEPKPGALVTGADMTLLTNFLRHYQIPFFIEWLPIEAV